MPTGVFLVEVGPEEFADAVLARSHRVPVVVAFCAAWSAPCRALLRKLERLAVEQEGAVAIVRFDVDAAPAVAQAWGVKALPTLKAFRGGAVVGELTGTATEAAVRALVVGLLPHGGAGKPQRGAEAVRTARESEAWLRAHLDAHPADLDARIVLGRLLIALGCYREGLEELLAVVQQDPHHADEAARKGMHDAFEVLGPGHELTFHYRTALAAALGAPSAPEE